MIILNIIAIFCLILVKGNVIPLEIENEDVVRSLKSSRTGTFKNVETQYDCSLSVQMTVTGFDIKMSEVLNHECWSTSSDIQIFALNKIFIDCDVIKNSAQLSIYAPIWETTGKQEIILSGEDGEPHKVQTVPGRNGEPGLPGGAGGIFIGVGQNFINPADLSIEANGGNGGPGQNGSKGINAIDGDEFKEEFIHSGRMLNHFETFLNELELEFTKTNKVRCASDFNCKMIRMFEIKGKTTNASGNGGNGGAGGLGGPAGLIHFEGFDNIPNYGIHKGEKGMSGFGGLPGDAARNGRDVECIFSLYMDRFIRCDWNDLTMAPGGKKGIFGGNKDNRIESPIAIADKYEDVMQSFKEFVRMNLVNSGIESDSIGFIEKL